MSEWHGRSRRKSTGRRYRSYRKKRKYETQGTDVQTRIGKRKSIKVRGRGGSKKVKLKKVNHANIFDTESGEAKRLEIKSVSKNPAHKEYARLNVITKGAIINTELGKARVTSSPGQSGVVNAVLLEESES